MDSLQLALLADVCVCERDSCHVVGLSTQQKKLMLITYTAMHIYWVAKFVQVFPLTL